MNMNWELSEYAAQSPPISYDAMWDTIFKYHDIITPFLYHDEYIMVFNGQPGTGKTWAAWATIDSYHKMVFTGHSEFIEWSELCVIILDRNRNDNYGCEARSKLAALKRADILVIDDFCESHFDDMHHIHSIINNRFNNKMRTLFVTSRSDNEIEHIIGTSISERLKSSIVINFTDVIR